MSSNHPLPKTNTDDGLHKTPAPNPQHQLPTTKKRRLNPIWQARVNRFRQNRLGVISLFIFAVILKNSYSLSFCVWLYLSFCPTNCFKQCSYNV